MEKFFDSVVRLLGSRELVLEGISSAATGAAIARDQRDYYKRLRQAVTEIPFKRENDAANATVNPFTWIPTAFNSFDQTLAGNPCTAKTDSEGTTTLRSVLPVLTQDKIDAITKATDPENPTAKTAEEAQFSQAFATAAVIISTATGYQQFGIDHLSGNEKNEFLAAVSAFSAARILGQFEPTLEQRFADQLSGMRGRLENYAAEYSQIGTTHREQFDSLSAAKVELTENFSNFQSEFDETKKRLREFETTIRSELELDRARLNWNKRYVEAKESLKYASIALGVAILLPLIITPFIATPILNFINRFDWVTFISGGTVGISFAHHLGRLAIISVPVISYFWLIKILVRYYMRSMLLMDDARQREVMLDTYFLLTSTGRADENDRPLILWALFRQTPGHGPDGIEPPDFTEVIRAGMIRGKS